MLGLSSTDRRYVPFLLRWLSRPDSIMIGSDQVLSSLTHPQTRTCALIVERTDITSIDLQASSRTLRTSADLRPHRTSQPSYVLASQTFATIVAHVRRERNPRAQLSPGWAIGDGRNVTVTSCLSDLYVTTELRSTTVW